jgi:predicted HD phosphohydrolase
VPIKSMKTGEEQDWQSIAAWNYARQLEMPARVKKLLTSLNSQIDGFGINQLQHGLQTATRAYRNGACEELIVAALCHDMGNLFVIENHARITAEILRLYVSDDVYEIIKTHQDFQLIHHDRRLAYKRWQYLNRKWYQTACQFSDEWDQASFDPDYDTLPLEHFAAMIENVFAYIRPQPASRIEKIISLVSRKLGRFFN